MKWRCLGCVLLAMIYCFVPNDVAGQETDTQQYITIGEETTQLSEPLTADGYVDYSAAINKINFAPASENAAAELILMWGVPRYWEQQQREKLKDALGVPAIPFQSERLKVFFDVVEDMKNRGLPLPGEDQLTDEWIFSSTRPWKKSESALIHHWLQGNAEYLARLDAIFKMPRYFEPMVVARDRGPVLAPIPCGLALDAQLRIRDLLVRRSFLHLAEERYQLVVDDILRLYRLTRLDKRSRIVVFTGMENVQFEDPAFELGRFLLKSRELPASVLRAYLNGLSQLGPVITAEEQCLYDRFSRLGFVEYCASRSPQKYCESIDFMRKLTRDLITTLDSEELANIFARESTFEPFVCDATSDQIDWDYLLKRINDRCDRAADIHGMNSTVGRLKAIHALTTEIEDRDPHFVTRRQYLNAYKEDATKASRLLTEDLELGLHESWFGYHYSTDEEFSRRARLDLMRIYIAARLYEKSQGQLPPNLGALSEELGGTPIDPFSEQPYRWKPIESGIEVSSASSDYEELPNSCRTNKIVIASLARDRD